MITKEQLDLEILYYQKERAALGPYLELNRALVHQQIDLIKKIETPRIKQSKEFPRMEEEAAIASIELENQERAYLEFVAKICETIIEESPEPKEEAKYFFTSYKMKAFLKKYWQVAILEPYHLIQEHWRDETTKEMFEFLLRQARVPFFIKASDSLEEEIELNLWTKGKCPYCGTTSIYGCLRQDDGKRMLFCPLCWHEWNFPRLKCVHCGITDPEKIDYFFAEGDEAHRVYLCHNCHMYFRVTDERRIKREVLCLVEDMVTKHLEAVAISRGYFAS